MEKYIFEAFSWSFGGFWIKLATHGKPIPHLPGMSQAKIGLCQKATHIAHSMWIWWQRKVAFFGPGPHFGLRFASLPWEGNIREALGKIKFDPSYDIFLWGNCVLFPPNILDNFHLRFSNIHIIIIDFIQSSSNIRRNIKLASTPTIMIMTTMVKTTVIMMMIRKAPPRLLISLERLDQHMWPININVKVDW